MLDAFEILTTSGVVLWSKQYAPVGVNVVNSLIRDVFIEENISSASTGPGDDSAERNPPYKKDKYTLKWTTAKDLGLIFVAVYQSLIQLSWIDKLLDNVKTLFTTLYRDQFKKPLTSEIECPFNEYFERQVQELEKTLRALPNSVPQTAMQSENASSVNARDDDARPPVPGMLKPPSRPLDGDATSNEASPLQSPDTSRPSTPNTSVLTAKSAPGSRASKRAARKAANTPGTSSRDISASGKGRTDKQTDKKKTARKWDDFGAMDDDNGEVLDYSASAANGAPNNSETASTSAIPASIPQSAWGRKTNKGEVVLKDLDEEMDSILASAAESKQKASASAASSGLVSSGIGTISGLFRNVVGGKTLTAEDLQKPLRAMEDHLIKKNVARDAAEHLCTSVQRDLVGTKTPSFTSIETAIHKSMDSALSKILTPTSGSTLDLLRSITSVVNHSDPTKRRPYVVSIVGVNGVGKSTTLAKLAFLLLHNNLRVLVAAADTFRSGAVEQLRVHVRNLQQLTARATDAEGLGSIDLYERGYGKDAASVARDAVTFASTPVGGERAFDVVLIDTAGRRHNDTRLMSSLAPFARAANPDKILMVGEALVGTDSVAQARHFNESFGTGRGLDGFIVSKCDTVGEMVGTLVSLVWSTGVPVVAVGVGQHYGDLRGFRVTWARDLLLHGDA